jgi:hypothetical protein
MNPCGRPVCASAYGRIAPAGLFLAGALPPSLIRFDRAHNPAMTQARGQPWRKGATAIMPVAIREMQILNERSPIQSHRRTTAGGNAGVTIGALRASSWRPYGKEGPLRSANVKHFGGPTNRADGGHGYLV